MERSYYIRERRISVEEIPGVIAVRASPDEAQRTKDFGLPALETVVAAGVAYHEKHVLSAGEVDHKKKAVAADDVAERTGLAEAARAFEAANWLFIEPSDDMTKRIQAGDPVRGCLGVGKVLIRAGPSIAIATNRLNVKLRPSLSATACRQKLAANNLKLLEELRISSNMFTVESETDDALAVSVALHEDGEFVFAEPSLIEYIPGRSDPEYWRQWHWKNNGGDWGTVGADVGAEDAWGITLGTNIRVAVIDNSFDFGHPDLAGSLSAACGYYSDNYPAVATFSLGTDGIPNDSHGTACAGIIGARRGNDLGGTGGAPECELLLIATLKDQIGEQQTLARAVKYAIDPSTEDGDPTLAADILSCSLGPLAVAAWELTATLEEALNEADAGRGGKGLPIFWATNDLLNAPVDEDGVVSHDNVIAVVSSNAHDKKTVGASGSEVELTAPGTGIYTTISRANINDYDYRSGTSYAGPCAAACGALALSANDNLTRDELRQILRDTADKVGDAGVIYGSDGHNDRYGYGRVNAYAAVSEATQMRTRRRKFGCLPLVLTTFAIAATILPIANWIRLRLR